MGDSCPACECEKRLDELERNPDSPEAKKGLAEVTRSYKDKLLPSLEITKLKGVGCPTHSNWNWDGFVNFVGRFNRQETKALLFGDTSTPQ